MWVLDFCYKVKMGRCGGLLLEPGTFLVVCLSELMSETYSCMQARLMLTWFILFFSFFYYFI